MAKLDYEQGRRQRGAQWSEAQGAWGEAAADLSRAQQLNLSQREQDAFAVKERQAKQYLDRLRAVNAAEEDYAGKTVARAAAIQSASFWQSTRMAELGAQFTGPNLASRQEIERRQLYVEQNAVWTTPEYLGFNARRAAISGAEDVVWRARWLREHPGSTPADADKALVREKADVARLQEHWKDVSRVQGLQRTGQEAEQAYQTHQVIAQLETRSALAVSLAGAGGQSLAGQYSREDIARLASQSAATYGMEKGSDLFKATVSAQGLENRAVLAERARAQEQRERAWRQEAAQARLSESRTIEDATKAQINALEFELREKERIYGRDAALEAATAARERAAGVSGQRAVRNRDVSLLAGALAAAGRTEQAQRLMLQLRTMETLESLPANSPLRGVLMTQQAVEAEQIHHQATYVSPEFQLHRQWGPGPTDRFGNQMQPLVQAMNTLNELLKPIAARLGAGGISVLNTLD